MLLLRGIQLPWNFSWVDEKKLAGTSAPTTEGQIKALAAEGISHLVSLSPETPPAPAPPEGLKITYIAVEDFEAPSPRQIRKFIKICEETHARGEAVAVHCRGGRGRTGTVGLDQPLGSICSVLWMLEYDNLVGQLTSHVTHNHRWIFPDAGGLLHVEEKPGRAGGSGLGPSSSARSRRV